MTTWEYRTVPTVLELEGLPTSHVDLLAAANVASGAWLEELNTLGADGWEVVGPLDLAGTAWVCQPDVAPLEGPVMA